MYSRTKIQNDHMKSENSLDIKFVLSCMINNVVFYENTTFLFGLLKSSKSVSKQRDAVGSIQLIIWYIDGEFMAGSDLVHDRRDIIRSINSSGVYLSIMVRFFRCMARDPEDLCHFSPSHPKSWVSLNKWRKSQSSIDYRCSNSVFQFRENIFIYD